MIALLWAVFFGNLSFRIFVDPLPMLEGETILTPTHSIYHIYFVSIKVKSKSQKDSPSVDF
jgi:hypothetical protein